MVALHFFLIWVNCTLGLETLKAERGSPSAPSDGQHIKFSLCNFLVFVAQYRSFRFRFFQMKHHDVQRDHLSRRKVLPVSIAVPRLGPSVA